MFRLLSYDIISIYILLIFTSVNVYGGTCRYDEIRCGIRPDEWCCSTDKYCGNYSGLCDFRTPTKGSSLTSLSYIRSKLHNVITSIHVIILVVFLCCIISLRRQQCAVPEINQRISHSNRQQSRQGPIRAAHVSLVCDASSAPPSYEVAMAHSLPQSPSTPPTSAAPIGNQTTSRGYFH